MGRGGAADRKLGKKEQKEWLDNTVNVADPHRCTAGNKRRKSTYRHIQTHTDTCNNT